MKPFPENETDFLKKTGIQFMNENSTIYNYMMTIVSVKMSSMVNQDEYPHIYLPLLSRNKGEIFKLMKDEKNSSEFITKMLDIQDKNDKEMIWLFKIVNIVWNLRCEQDVIRKENKLICMIANFTKNIDPMKISYNCTYFLLYYYPSMYWDDVDKILGLNLTNRDILSKYEGIMNFCPEFVKESFDFRHQCYRFNSEEIFPYPNKASIGIVFPNDIQYDLIGEKGFWFSIVDKTKEGKSDDNTSSIYNSLDWKYLRPGVHTVSIDATRNLILRRTKESQCGDPDIISNYNYDQCIKQKCDPIKKKTKWDCILPIKTSSKVDKKHKMCMEMPNDIVKYYEECVKKCKEYCDFWTYSISDVKSERFNETVAYKFLDIEKSDLRNRFYIRLLYNQNRYGLSEQSYKITFTQFLSNIGGTTGVCIGISLMSICQILLYATMVFVGRVKKNRRERNSQEVGNHDNP